MAYSLKYDTLLTSIECGDARDAINLFKSGAYDVNIEISYIFEDRRQYTITPLYWAVRHRRQKICHYLLRNGANPYHHLVYAYYPLHEACDRGYDDIVQEFVDAKCDLNRVTNDMDTPLHIACVRSHIECVHILLRAGADCNLLNKMLRIPLQEALYHNHHELIKLFEAYDQANFRPCSQQLSRTTRAKSPNPTATTTIAMTMTTSAQLQRSHSLNEPRGGNPASAPLIQNSASCPHSVILEDTGSSSALVVTGALQRPLTSRRRQQYLPSSSTYSCTQPNVTSLTNSSAMLSHSLQSLPKQQKHPLSAAQKFPQAHHRKHGEKPLCGSVSHPEFYTASKQELVFGERTVSCDGLLVLNLPSPAREKIDHLSRNLMVSLNSGSVQQLKQHEADDVTHHLDCIQAPHQLRTNCVQTLSVKELVKLPVAAHWYELGVQLGVPTDKLKEIEVNYPHQAKLCLHEVFDWWLENGKSPTRRQLVKALEVIDRRDLAKEVRSQRQKAVPGGEKKSGFRKLWGAMKDCTTEFVEKTLGRLADGLGIRRRYKKHNNVKRWWFELEAEESDFQALECSKEWKKVQATKRWRLGECFMASA